MLVLAWEQGEGAVRIQTHPPPRDPPKFSNMSSSKLRFLGKLVAPQAPKNFSGHMVWSKIEEVDGEDGEVGEPDVSLESTGAIASVLQATALDNDMLFVRFEGQRIHIQQLLNLRVLETP